MSLSLNSYAITDPSSQLNYCEMERDQAEKTLDICNESLQDCKNLITLTEAELDSYKKISTTQTTEVVSQKKEIDNLEKSSTTGHIIFGVLGIIVGLVIHIPLAAFVK